VIFEVISDARLDRVQRAAFTAGVAGLAISGILGVFAHAQFFRSYLVAFAFWSGVPLGALAVLMLHHLVGGGWGYLIRRELEAATRTLPLAAGLALPVLIGIPFLYTWAHHGVLAGDPLLQHKHIYLNVPFYVIRTIAYFAIWTVLARLLNRWSAEQDDPRTASQAASRLYALSGPGLVIYGLTMTFASVDWVMSLEPDWFSTIYSAMLMIGQVLSALAFVTALLLLLIEKEPLTELASPQYLVDLGNMLLAFVILWAYVSFSQFLIIWSGNLTDEIGWYLRRLRGGWQWLALALVVYHFALPFVLLLRRGLKRRIRSLAWLAAVLFIVRFLDMIWNVDPAFDGGHFRVHLLDWTAAIGLGGIWIGVFLAQLKRRPLLPLHDPAVPKVFAAAEGAS
jgi:hypothetical protein